MIEGLLVGSAVSFLVTFLVIPRLIGILKSRGITGVDVHKSSKPVCAEMGGSAVILGFSIGFAISLALSPEVDRNLVLAFATVLLVGCVGILDDLVTLRQRYKPFLTALASIPLLYASIGRQEFWFPLAGAVFLGSYFLLTVPLSVATASNMTNMFAGFNGLESGVAMLGCFALGVAAVLYGNADVSLIAFPLCAAFLAFLRYNWYPAKIFPGDAGTLVSGSAVAAISILGRVELVGIFVIAPCAIDFTLKMVSRHPFSQRSQLGDTRADDEQALVPPTYPALAHAFLRVGRLKEQELVLVLLFMESIYAFIGILMMSLQ